MAELFFDISTSLDGYVAGPNQTLGEPLGRGGEQLHGWAYPLRVWREPHGLDGGETSPASELVAESLARTGAMVMGRSMFSGGEGPWGSDPNPDGWWGSNPPFHHPVFVLTHHSREPLEMEGGTTFYFVTDGIEAALERARDATGEKDVQIGGGGSVVQQYLKAGLVDDFRIHIVPVLLGDGVRLFEDHLPGDQLRLECTGVVEEPAAAHISYRVVQ